MISGLKRILNRTAARVSMRFHVATANAWRDSYNPLRGLNMMRAVSYLEEGERGAFAGLQWLYRYSDMQDATLGALIERRTSAVQKMPWDVRIPEGLSGADERLAEKQAAVLKKVYGGIENLAESIEHLCMASFRGFAVLEIVEEAGAITRLEIVPQWYWVRNGLNGKWEYNRESRIGSVTGEEIVEENFVIREVQRPINRVALVCTVRKGMSLKDWDGFIETFGIPAVFIIAPENIPADKEGAYQEVAEGIASDARGVLPGGSRVETVDNGARGVNPFLEHIKYQDEQVILRGTGGKLTMLAESGSGTLAGSAHQDTFDEIAEAEAKEISEFLRQAVDAQVLAREFPGQKKLAFFQIAANEETDSKAVVREVAILKKAGYQVKKDQVSEKTGYELELVADESAGEVEELVKNRAKTLTALLRNIAGGSHHLGQSRDGSGRFGAMGFHSEYTGNESTSLSEIYPRLSGPEQAAAKRLARRINAEVGIEAEQFDALGDFDGTLENSIMETFGPVTAEELQYVMARKGVANDQIGTLAFHLNPEGEDVMFQFTGFDTVAGARESLDRAGLKLRTVVERPEGGYEAYVYTREIEVETLRELQNGGQITIESISGTAYELGDWETWDRATGVARQQEIIDLYENDHGKRSGTSTWNRRPHSRVDEGWHGRSGDQSGDESREDREGRGAQGAAEGDEVDGFSEESRAEIEAALAADLMPVFRLLEEAAAAKDEASRDELLAQVKTAFEQMEVGETSAVFEAVLASALVNGWAESGLAQKEGENS